MNRRLHLAVAVVLVAFASGVVVAREVAKPDAPARPAPAAEQDGVSVYFSPNGGCTAAIVAQLRAARKTVDVQAYSFTSAPIAEAVVQAAARGVKVRAVLDGGSVGDKYSAATFLHNHQVPVWVDREHKIAHNKIIIVDGATVVTGSFNFSKAAEESNAENLLVVQGKPAIVDAYRTNFEAHLAHAQPYTGIAPPPSRRR